MTYLEESQSDFYVLLQGRRDESERVLSAAAAFSEPIP
jgi:hypothetical protein